MQDEYLRRVAGADEGLQRNPSGTYVQVLPPATPSLLLSLHCDLPRLQA